MITSQTRIEPKYTARDLMITGQARIGPKYTARNLMITGQARIGPKYTARDLMITGQARIGPKYTDRNVMITSQARIGPELYSPRSHDYQSDTDPTELCGSAPEINDTQVLPKRTGSLAAEAKDPERRKHFTTEKVTTKLLLLIPRHTIVASIM